MYFRTWLFRRVLIRGASDADTGTDGSLSWGEATSSVFEVIVIEDLELGDNFLRR